MILADLIWVLYMRFPRNIEKNGYPYTILRSELKWIKQIPKKISIVNITKEGTNRLISLS
jgi:hypothetical protein